MRTLLLTLTLAFFTVATPTFAAFTLNVGNTVTLTKPVASSSTGGPFLATLSGGGTGSFTTFCVELDHYFSLGTPYTVTGISDETRAGGRDLTEKVAWIYTKFLNNTVSADVAQYGIWLNMGFNVDSGGGPYIRNAFSSLDNTLFGSLQSAYASFIAGFVATPNWYDAYGVKIMQIGDNQSQLIPGNPNPDITAATPEPTTLAIWGGLAALGLTVRAYRR